MSIPTNISTNLDLGDVDHITLGNGTMIAFGGFGADVIHFASGLDDHRFPIFADDHEQQGRSAERLRALRDAGAQVIPGHDPEILHPGPLGGV